MTKTELKQAKERYFAQSKFIEKLTAENLIKESVDEQQARIQRLLKPENYIEFFDYYFGVNSGLPLADAPSSWFHQKSYETLYKDRYIRQMRQWFRGAAKSIHTNVGNVLHLKQNDELFFAVLVGANEGMAKILLSDLQMHLESNQRLIKDFGKQVSYGDWADGQFQTTDGKFFKALGLNQPFRGLRFGEYRPDFASVDDCEDRDRAKRPEMVRKYGEKITGDLVKAFHLRRGRLVVPNNYIVKDGLLDFIESKFKDSKHFNKIVVNLTDKNGKPSWPERYSQEDVDRINADTDYYTSQREDYNNPIEEGKLFKADQIKNRKVHHRETFDGFLIHWDLSYTSTGDYKAGVLVGIKGTDLTVLELFCQRCEVNSAMDVNFEWTEKYLKRYGLVPLAFYDASVAQQAVFTPIIAQCAEDANSPYIPLPRHQSGDKHNRIASTLLNVLHRGILTFDEKLEERSKKDHKAFMNQVLSFEKGTKSNDDAPDTLERACALAQLYFGYSDNKNAGKPAIGKRKKSRRV